MADTPKAVAAPQMVVIDSQQHAARELAAELQKRREDGTEMNKTVPGGRYLRSDGKTFQDAWGNEIKEEGGAKKGAANLTSPEDIGARLRELEEERTKLLAQQQVVTSQAQAEAAAASMGQGSGEGEDDEPSARRSAAKKHGRGK